MRVCNRVRLCVCARERERERQREREREHLLVRKFGVFAYGLQAQKSCTPIYTRQSTTSTHTQTQTQLPFSVFPHAEKLLKRRPVYKRVAVLSSVICTMALLFVQARVSEHTIYQKNLSTKQPMKKGSQTG